MLDLDHLKELLAKATPGPWTAFQASAEIWEDDYGRRCHFIDYGRILEISPPIATLLPRGSERSECQINGYSNVLLIAAAVNALPSLISALEAEREKVAKLRKFVKDWERWESNLADPNCHFDHTYLQRARKLLRPRAYKETGDEA